MGSQPYAVCVILRADRQGFFSFVESLMLSIRILGM